jgi:hypothetical protein
MRPSRWASSGHSGTARDLNYDRSGDSSSGSSSTI